MAVRALGAFSEGHQWFSNEEGTHSLEGWATASPMSFFLRYLPAPESVGDYDFETCYGLIFSVFSNCFNLSLYCVLSDFLFLFLFLNTVLFLNAELMSGAQTCLSFAS